MKLLHFLYMKSYLIQVVALFALSVIIGNCSSSFTTSNEVHRRMNISYLAIDEDDHPGDSDLRKQIQPIVKTPEFSEDNWKAILGNLEYIYRSTWSNQQRRVYNEAQLDDLVDGLRESLAGVKPNQRVAVISRFDPDRSVLSRMERVTLLVWSDEKFLNLAFGEINYPVPHNDPLSYESWRDVLPVSLRRSYHYYALVKSKDYQFKVINGFKHKTWVQYPLDKINNLKYQAPDARVVNSDFTEEADSEKKRLRKLLDDSLAAGIIDEKVYNQRLKALEKGEPKDETPEAEAIPATEATPATEETPPTE